MTEPFRPWHYLKPVKKTSGPTDIVVVDTEAKRQDHPVFPDGEIQTFRLGVCVVLRLEAGRVTRRKVYRLRCVADFWDVLGALTDKRTSVWVFAHNLGYDFTLLCGWESLEHGGYAPELLVLEDPPSFLNLRHGGCKVTWVDTYNYWRTSLARLGRAIGRDKSDWPGWSAGDEELLDHCEQDVHVLEMVVVGLIGWWKSLDLGPFRPTGAGLAWSAWRRSLPARTVLIHGHQEAVQLERESYYGGEVRTFYVGRAEPAGTHWAEIVNPGKGRSRAVVPSPVFAVDVQSCYVSAMAEGRYPVRLVRYDEVAEAGALDRLGDQCGAVAEVKLETWRETFPVKLKSRTVHARGKFWTVLAGPELMVAHELGLVKEVGRMAIYELLPILRTFARDFWAMRRECSIRGDKLGEELSKLVGNSLSGKFAQRSSRWEGVNDLVAPIPWGTFVERTVDEPGQRVCRSIAWHVQERFERGEWRDSSPAIAAFITAYGREMMRRYRNIAGDGNVFYQDTDCLHCNLEGFENLDRAGVVKPDALGMLSVVRVTRSAEWFGPKHYRLGDYLVTGAISAHAKQTAPGVYAQLNFQRIASTIQTSPRGAITVRPVVKKLSWCHPTGKAGQDGWVAPITLGQADG